MSPSKKKLFFAMTSAGVAVASLVIQSVFVCAAWAGPAPRTLRNAYLEVTVDLGTGGIREIRDLLLTGSPMVFGADDEVLGAAAGDFRPAGFLAASDDSESVMLVAYEFRNGKAAIPLGVTIRYKLTGPRLNVEYRFNARGFVNLDKGLDVNISSSSWDSLYVRNQYSGEAPFAFGRSAGARHLALNQVYELHNVFRNLSLVFPNPYHSLVSVAPGEMHSFKLSWHILAAAGPFQAVEPKGPPLASVLAPGVELRRQIVLIVGHDDEPASDPAGPVAYFSPFPSGYDQVIAMTFDDIPFEKWVFPKSSSDTIAPIQRCLVRLLEDHPKMKMGWIVLLDPIFSEAGLANPDYPSGEWWRARGTHRILTQAPGKFLEWLRAIDRDSVVYGYENRVHLGVHGLHHTPEMLFGTNFEFQSYDETLNDSTFSAIVREYSLLGLSARSRRWIRFPGFFFTRATVESLIKYGFVLFDYWGIYDKLPWLQVYSEHGRIWGIGTLWAGDRPSPYEMMDKILRAGKLCHTAGHPINWFDGDREASYQQIHAIFRQAEINFPNLGYMFPDDVGYFADETCDINTVESKMESDCVSFSFDGSAALGQTVIIEWPYANHTRTSVTVDGRAVFQTEWRGRKLVIVLPSLAAGPHVVRVSGVPRSTHTKVTPSSLVLLQNYPNPFNAGTVIRYGLAKAAHVKLTVFDVRGDRVAVLADQRQEAAMHALQWDGRDMNGRLVASGVYFYRLEAGGSTTVRKLTVVR